MTRSELITRIAKRLPHLVQKDALMATHLILDAIADSLRLRRRVEIRNFGSFSIHARPGRTGRNPKNGEPVIVPEKHVPHFKPGKGLLSTLSPASTNARETPDKRGGPQAESMKSGAVNHSCP